MSNSVLPVQLHGVFRRQYQAGAFGQVVRQDACTCKDKCGVAQFTMLHQRASSVHCGRVAYPLPLAAVCFGGLDFGPDLGSAGLGFKPQPLLARFGAHQAVLCTAIRNCQQKLVGTRIHM